MHWAVGIVCIGAAAFETALAQESLEIAPADALASPVDDLEGPPQNLLDRTHEGLHSLLWRSAMYVDGWFGSQTPEHVYADRTRGSITPIVLWDEFNGFTQKFRFRVKMPLPQLDERYNAFIGTFSRDEFVTEREQASGAIPRQGTGGEIEQDETLVGLQYRGRRKAGRFEADAGIRIRMPLDPFVKAGYRFEHEIAHQTLLTLRETAFWQNSEGLGVTSRVDIERAFDIDSLVRWTASATISEKSEGVRGYTNLTGYRALSSSSAVGAQVFTEGSFDADVPIGEYGFRAAYRRQVLRDWLVLELRPSLTWPK
ncbi:MAG TPA: hypothetical protein VHK24_05005, partial [Steroidobacter sp.]|nr:hypothetical protein [Steroidobacter sp.]